MRTPDHSRPSPDTHHGLMSSALHSLQKRDCALVAADPGRADRYATLAFMALAAAVRCEDRRRTARQECASERRAALNADWRWWVADDLRALRRTAYRRDVSALSYANAGDYELRATGRTYRRLARGEWVAAVRADVATDAATNAATAYLTV